MYVNWPGWPDSRTAIIAEVGLNHGGNIETAWEMIQSAHLNGADFVKLQTFVLEDFYHPSLPSYTSMKSMQLSVESQRVLFKKADASGIKLMTTPFDPASVDIADDFTPPAYKIASMDNDNIPLIQYIAEKGRPVIVSCGMADIGEIQTIANTMENVGNNKLVLLHCTSDYPAKPQDLNLSMINYLKNIFDCSVGLSDHSIGLTSSYIAASLGVTVIEKHFTTDKLLAKKYPDADNDISINPEELKSLREFCDIATIMLGEAPRRFTEGEIAGRKGVRRGIYARRDIKNGERLTLENTVFLRPVKGIKAGSWKDIFGKEIVRNISRLQPIFFSDLGL
ncbi:MAG: NeuB family protein [Parcubacteria group bacterium]|nr:NeuB family protein [Parcubacteria group bacterium]